MAKKLLLLAALFGMTLQGVGQNLFTVKLPPFRRYVKVTANDVNLRQQPSAQSARLIWEGCYDELGIGGERLIWSTGTLKQGERPARATVLPVWESSFLSVVKDADGWLCGHYRGKMVYVMEKFCKDVSLRPLSLPLPQPENIIGQDEVFFLEKLIKIDAGQYKDYCIGWSSEGMDIPERLHIGKYENGMFVFNFSINCGIHSDIGNKTFIEGHKFYYGEAFHDTESYGISLHKLSKDRQALDKLMSISKDIPHYYDPYILFGVEGDYNWYIIEGIG